MLDVGTVKRHEELVHSLTGQNLKRKEILVTMINGTVSTNLIGKKEN
jgi:hypothetical protein